LPHLVLTFNTAREIPYDGRTNHHHPNYFRTHSDLEGAMNIESVLHNMNGLSLGKLGGFAVRVSRTHRLVPAYHKILHDRFPLGPELAHTVHEKYKATVKNCAGVMPREALDLTRPEGEELVYMDDETFAAVTDPWWVHVENYYYDRPGGYQRKVLGNFFLRYATLQDMSHIPDVVDEFLHTTDTARKFQLGRIMLEDGTDMSIAPIVPMHTELRDLGMVREDSPGLRQAVWGNTTPEMVQKVLPVLAKRLAA
jgi:hypothetical protein